MHIKTIILLLLVNLCFPNCIWTQNKGDYPKQNQGIEIQSQAEKDWIAVDTIKTYFCKSSKELERYNNATFLEQRRFEDAIEKKRLRLAESFLDKYPKNDHYYDVLKYFFHYLFEPKFISENIPNSTVVLLSQDSKLTKTNRSFFLSQMRALPIDKEARDRWLKKGNVLVQKFLESNAPMEQKAKIEILLMGRDLRMALLLYEYMDFQKEAVESSYWERFDGYYWETFQLRIKTLLLKYPDLESMASLVERYISIVSRKYLSPELREIYWNYFFDITDSINPKTSDKGLAAVHNMAKENLKALEALKGFDESQPLEMKFTAMDGTEIDLETMRGKVVLIDFWSIRCGPCIQEMPHVKALYDKYKEKGFEVLGIAAHGDSSKEQVLKILKKQKVNWPQRLDKGSLANVSYHSLYKITSLPTVWLLDKEGKVVDKNARGARLEPLIRKYLNLD